MKWEQLWPREKCKQMQAPRTAGLLSAGSRRNWCCAEFWPLDSPQCRQSAADSTVQILHCRHAQQKRAHFAALLHAGPAGRTVCGFAVGRLQVALLVCRPFWRLVCRIARMPARWTNRVTQLEGVSSAFLAHFRPQFGARKRPNFHFWQLASLQTPISPHRNVLSPSQKLAGQLAPTFRPAPHPQSPLLARTQAAHKPR